MIGVLIAALGTTGVYLIVTDAMRGETDRPDREPLSHRVATAVRGWMDQAGLHEVRISEFVAVTALLAALGAAVGAAMFGGILPALAAGAFAASIPPASYRQRRARRRAVAEDAWPTMIDEIRVLCGAAGRSIPQALLDGGQIGQCQFGIDDVPVPQALLDVGLRSPGELRPAFVSGQRVWALTTDFDRTVATIKQQLDSPSADAACETLLVAHELGGSDLDRRLDELAEDRRLDTTGRKDARSKQSGVRFARRFVVIVPLGMALAGMSLGNGRAAYATPTGQVLVSLGLGLIVVCWIWSGRILRLPLEERVFR